jgi:hypothetical protein
VYVTELVFNDGTRTFYSFESKGEAEFWVAGYSPAPDQTVLTFNTFKVNTEETCRCFYCIEMDEWFVTKDESIVKEDQIYDNELGIWTY